MKRRAAGEMAWGDRLRTIAITATLTSAAWILAGSSVIESLDSGLAIVRRTEPTTPASPSAGRVPADRRSASSAHREEAQPLLPATASEFIIPVEGVKAGNLTDSFTDARGGNTRVHEAIDIMAPSGSKVRAAFGGRVEKLYQSERGGNTVYVRSPDRRTIAYYAHLEHYAPGLLEGQQVSRGQVLGTVGSTGNADPAAPHLHFALMQTTPDAGWWEPANAVNPYTVLTASTR